MPDAPSAAEPDLPTAALRATLDVVDTPVFVFDAAGTTQFANQTATAVTGQAAAAIRGLRIEELVGGADVAAVEQAVADVFDDGEATVDVSLSTTNSESIPVELRLASLSARTPGASAFAGIARRKPDADRIDSVEAEVLDRMSDAFYAIDELWRLTHVNDGAAEILSAAMGLDITSKDLLGRNILDEIPDVLDTTFHENLQTVLDTQVPATFEEYYEPLDTWFQVRAYPSETGLSVYFWDSSERHRQNEALAERERILREMHDVTADTSLTFDEQVQDLLKIGREVVGTSYATLSRIRDEEYEFEAVLADDDSIEAGDTAALSATNCERTVAEKRTLVLSNVATDAPELTDKEGYREWGIACYLGAPVLVDGDVYGTFCFYDDEPRTEPFSEWQVTVVDLLSQWLGYELTRQRTQEQLERRNDQLEEFAAIVSHDLRNPLSLLSGYLELAESEPSPEHFQQCRDAIDQMNALIEDLLALARAGEQIAEQQPTALAAAVETSWQTLETGDHELDNRTGASIRADESRLGQLLGNLFRNAVEHGGDTVTVGDIASGFYVADDGPGIPDHKQADVFEPGYTTAQDGTGFGLNIVEQIAEGHGWHVDVRTDAEGGARFEFTGVEKTD